MAWKGMVSTGLKGSGLIDDRSLYVTRYTCRGYRVYITVIEMMEKKMGTTIMGDTGTYLSKYQVSLGFIQVQSLGFRKTFVSFWCLQSHAL